MQSDTTGHRRLSKLFSKGNKCLSFGGTFQSSDAFVDSNLHPVLKEMLQELYFHAPFSMHVFGILPDVTACINLKMQLEVGEKIDWHHYSIYIIAAVAMNYLHSMVSPLLSFELYDSWMEINTQNSVLEIKNNLKCAILKLDASNQEILKYFLLILRRVCQCCQSSHTTPILAGYFVAPSFLWKDRYIMYPPKEVHQQVARLIKNMIIFVDYIWPNFDETKMFHGSKTTKCQETLEGALQGITPIPPKRLIDSLKEQARHNDTDVSLLKLGISAEESFDAKSSFNESYTDEDYLYPDWVFEFPEWECVSNKLPSWCLQSNYTMNLNDIAAETNDNVGTSGLSKSAEKKLIDLSQNFTLQQNFTRKQANRVLAFGGKASDTLFAEALKLLIPFISSYMHEVGFSQMHKWEVIEKRFRADSLAKAPSSADLRLPPPFDRLTGTKF